MINVAKGGLAGVVGCTTWPPPTGKEMRWAAYAFWKAAEANKAVRNGRRRAAPGRVGRAAWRQGRGSGARGSVGNSIAAVCQCVYTHTLTICRRKSASQI
jgi:hypothetical protein